ncbi:MAG TPA: hypothetical protein VF482_17515 [Trebonia sp.]
MNVAQYVPAAAALVQALGGAAAIGTVMPLLVAVVIRSHWPSEIKATIAVAASLVAGTVSAYLAGQLTGLPWAASVVVALVASQQTYSRWWHATGIAQWVERVTQPQIAEDVATVTEALAAVDASTKARSS